MKDPVQRYQSAAELAHALLPFAPARARLHAERATSVLRAADPNGGEPLPSTLPEGRAAPETNLGTAAPTVLGAGVTARRSGQRVSTLAVAFLACALCVGLGFAGFRGLRGAGTAGLPPGTAPTPAAANPGAGQEQSGRTDAPETKARPPSVQPMEGAAPRPAPTLTSTQKSKPEPSRARGKGRPAGGVAPARVAAIDALPPGEPKRAAEEPRGAKSRVRLLDDHSPVRLLE